MIKGYHTGLLCGGIPFKDVEVTWLNLKHIATIYPARNSEHCNVTMCAGSAITYLVKVPPATLAEMVGRRG